MNSGIPNRRQTDDIRDDIDSLLRSTSTEEGKGVVNVFLRMYEELRDISKTLHQQNEQAKRDGQAIADILSRHEKRMDDHELAYMNKVNTDNIEKAKIDERNALVYRILTMFSGAALAFSVGAFWKFIAMEKAFDRIDILEQTSKEHGSKLYELEKMILTETRFSMIREDVNGLKKKNATLEKLKVIQNSKVGS